MRSRRQKIATESPQRYLHSPQRYLHDDIILEILYRLPVKSLLRFSWVSKSWYALFRTSTFAAAHREIYNNNNKICSNDSKYLVYMPDDPQKPEQVCTVLRDAQKFDSTLPLSGGYTVVGACEGLICLRKRFSIYIWNPLIGSLCIVPPSPTTVILMHAPEFGFGFARRIGDHRVLKIYSPFEGGVGVEMYSLAEDRWKKIENHSNHPLAERLWIFSSMSFFEGSVCWLAQKSSDHRVHVILKFDMDEEIFEEMAAPQLEQPLNKVWEVELAVANGFLVLLELVRERQNYLHACLWVKNETGWSWIGKDVYVPTGMSRRFVGMTKAGHHIFEETESKKLFAYDGFKSRDLGICCNSNKFCIVPMTEETLFLLDHRSDGGKDDHRSGGGKDEYLRSRGEIRVR